MKLKSFIGWVPFLDTLDGEGIMLHNAAIDAINNFSGTVTVLGVKVTMENGKPITDIPCHRCGNFVNPRDCVARWGTMQVCVSCLCAMQTIADLEAFKFCETCGK